MVANLPTRSLGGCLSVALLWAGVMGCHGLADKVGLHSSFDVPPSSQVVAVWSNALRRAPDTTRGGAPMLGLTGRVYLYSADLSTPMEACGNLKVSLYDHTGQQLGQGPKLLEVWNFDAASLEKLKADDLFGKGYQLFLPWSTYRPDIRQVYMMVEYMPYGGLEPMSAPGSLLAIDHSSLKDGHAQFQTQHGTPVPAPLPPGLPGVPLQSPPSALLPTPKEAGE